MPTTGTLRPPQNQSNDDLNRQAIKELQRMGLIRRSRVRRGGWSLTKAGRETVDQQSGYRRGGWALTEAGREALQRS
jgi:ribosomal protein S19E (S16A)